MLRYVTNGVLLQEVPSEISFGITLLGCPRHCAQCHSSFYWDTNVDPSKGKKFNASNVALDINKEMYHNDFSTIVFFGGDWKITTFLDTIVELKYDDVYLPYRYYDFAWYTALSLEKLNDYPRVYDLFSYIKTGEYNYKLGGLNSPTTNQRMYKRTFKDITSEFWNE